MSARGLHQRENGVCPPSCITQKPLCGSAFADRPRTGRAENKARCSRLATGCRIICREWPPDRLPAWKWDECRIPSPESPVRRATRRPAARGRDKCSSRPVQQREQNGHGLLFVPGKHERKRQIVHAAVEGSGQREGHLNGSIGIVALSHIQKTGNAADVAEIEIVEAELAAGQGKHHVSAGVCFTNSV